jgi:quinoprotein glucose dehydrogenase
VAPPPLVRQGPVKPEEAWGLTFWDKGACRKIIENSRSEGIFQPPSLDKDSIMRPGNAGGFNWGGIAFDPEHQLAVGNSMDLPFLVDLMPTNARHAQYISGKYDDWEFARMDGTPYGMRREVMKSPLKIPCIKPPWSTLAAVDMVHGTIKWQIPLGDTPFIHMNVGVPAIGGPIITAGGLVFIGATLTDDRFRAFDIKDGKLLWEVKLPAGGQATPMTYSIDGRQYVVIAAGGYKGDSTRGDYLIAYALPQ